LLQGADGRVRACRAGVLAHLPPDRFFVLSSHRRFEPAAGDTVVGVVQDKLAEHYRVRLHGTAIAHLPLLAFQMRMERSLEALARRPLPAGPKAHRLVTLSVWPVSVWRHAPLVTSQMQTMGSAPGAKARRPPLPPGPPPAR